MQAETEFDRAAGLARELHCDDQTKLKVAHVISKCYILNPNPQLYALYKQARVGKCTIARPSFFQFTERAKVISLNMLNLTHQL